MGFNEDMAGTDQLVDDLLGDDILFKDAGSAAYVSIKGFIGSVERGLSFSEIDIGGNGDRIKVSKLLIPKVTKQQRFKSPLLGSAVYAPMDAEAQTAGRYWIFEVQKASTNL